MPESMLRESAHDRTARLARAASVFKPLLPVDTRTVLVRYEEVDPNADNDAPQVGLFVCEVAELVFAANVGTALLAELARGNTLYGSLRPPPDHPLRRGQPDRSTFQILGCSESNDAVPHLSAETLAMAAGWKVGFDVVDLLREDIDGQRGTAQAGVEDEFRAGRNPRSGTVWELTPQTYLTVCEKWGWDTEFTLADLESDDLSGSGEEPGDADPDAEDDEDPEEVQAPRSEVMAAIDRSPLMFSIRFVSQQGRSLKEYELRTYKRSGDGARPVPGATRIAEGDGPDILVMDISDDSHNPEYGWSTIAELRAFLGEVVWPNLTAFQLDRGWSIQDVLYGLGVPGEWGTPTWESLLSQPQPQPGQENDA